MRNLSQRQESSTPNGSSPGAKSAFNRLNESAGRASWSAFRQQVEHLRWVDSLGDTGRWLEGVAPTKIADFAGDTAAADAGVMRDVAPLKRTALLACMVHAARMKARDDLAEMFCKRMASITKRAKEELDAIRERQRELSERLIGNYRDVLVSLDPPSEPADPATTLDRARGKVAGAGGFDGQLADIEAVSAHHANNYLPLVARHWRRDRSTMFAFLGLAGAARLYCHSSAVHCQEAAHALPPNLRFRCQKTCAAQQSRPLICVFVCVHPQ